MPSMQRLSLLSPIRRTRTDFIHRFSDVISYECLLINAAMIVFNLACSNDHRFEGWFASTADFEQQKRSELLNCPVCGAREINKALHVPHVSTSGKSQISGKNALQQCTNITSDFSQLLDYIVANTEDVGNEFPEEARKIHYREVPERKIRGSASAEEVDELREEGVEIIVLPVPSHRFGKAH